MIFKNMINLLPFENRSEIKKEYLARLAAIMFFCLFFSALIAIALLLPALFLVNSQEQNYERQISLSERRLALSGVAGMLPAAKELNLKLELFENRKKNAGEITPVIEKIINRRPWGVKLNGFLYDNLMKQSGERGILIKGSSVSRKYLLEFIDVLKKSGDFKEIKSPASNLLKGKNVEFNIFISLKGYEE